MPYTTLVSGTTITASWANANVRDQTISPFASASARDSAITVPIEGQYAHLTDTNLLTHYNGSAWVPANNNIVARQTPLTADSTTWTADATTDHAISSIAVSVNRLYRVHLHTNYTVTGAGRWNVNFHVGGTLTDRIDDLSHAATFIGEVDSSILWFPSTGTVNVDIRVDEIVDGSSLQFLGAATATRQFWVEDIGPR